MTDVPRTVAVQWLMLSCLVCGHWVKGEQSKDEVAAWLRVHRSPRIDFGTPGVTRESTCPRPCGSDCSECGHPVTAHHECPCEWGPLT